MKYRLPDTIASSQDLTALILEIKNYAKWFEHELIKMHVNVKHVSKSPELSPSAAELIHDLSQKKQISQSNLDELIDMLKDFSKKSPNITITLASIPTNNIKKIIVNWFRENISPNALIDFRFNATILGGIVVHVGSKILDMSFRRQILANKNIIPEVLRRV